MSHSFRLTLLSPRALRIEHSPTGEFVDGPSFFFMERGHGEPWSPTSAEGTGATWVSDHWEVRVQDLNAGLTRENLEIKWSHGAREGTWRPGDIDDQNLGGAFTALDNLSRLITAQGVAPWDPLDGHDAHRCTTHDVMLAVERALEKVLGRFPETQERNEEIERLVAGQPPKRLDAWPEGARAALERVRHFPPGFLSRSGLVIIRDDSPLWDANANWIHPRPAGHTDITFIAQGDDLKGALGEIANFAGPIALLPRWAFGMWFSCFRKMGEAEFRQLAADFDAHDLPLDLVVVDTDWHSHRWHGFDWNRDLFPDPERFFTWLRERGLHTTFNVHPRFLPADDPGAAEFIRTTGHHGLPVDEKTAPHPLHVGCLDVDLTDPVQTKAWFELHRPISEAGCDLWWIDGTAIHWDGRDATVWLNHLYARHMADVGSETPLAFSRASGLGCHRSTLPFSGDTLSQWEVLAQEVEMTARSAFSLLGHWSHDIGGFATGEPDWEENKPPANLYVRWFQFGCLSPVMRVHSDHGVREPWLFGSEALTLCREALQLRMGLVPHLHTLAREAHETGVCLWRPMCLEFPAVEEAYQRWHQVMIGESLLFAPVLNPEGEIEVWFPEGKWRHVQTREIIEGPCVKRWTAPLHEIPLFLRGGHTIKIAPPAKCTADIDESKSEALTC